MTAGDMTTAEMKALVQKHLGAWKTAVLRPATSHAAVPAPKALRVIVVERPEANPELERRLGAKLEQLIRDHRVAQLEALAEPLEAVVEAIRILERYRLPASPFAEPGLRAGVGYGATEAMPVMGAAQSGVFGTLSRPLPRM